MKPSSGPRKTANLSDLAHHRLNMYALVASAMEVGLLALAQPAEGKIVYTPAHHVIGVNSRFNLDLNHDGIIDFTIQDNLHTRTSGAKRSLFVTGSNEVEGTVGSHAFLAAALKPGGHIPKGRFSTKPQMVYQCSGTSCTPGTGSRRFGNWRNVTNRYLGLKFKIHGKIHYGWARLSVRFVPFQKLTATLTGYAYETIPNKAIIAGKTMGPDDSNIGAPDPAALIAPTPERATLDLLALGWSQPPSGAARSRQPRRLVPRLLLAR